MDTARVILETHDLSRHFGGLKAVDGVNLRVQEGQLHSIIGPNGAGKTTLFNLLSGSLPPTRGRILFRGQDITDLASHRMAHLGLGRSFQITNLFPNLTVLENARLAAQSLGGDNFRLLAPARRFREYEEKAYAALEETGLAAMAQATALSLPHGDQRKLELALLVAQDLSVWLLDEPAAGLATAQVPEFMALVDRARRSGNKTVVLVEHNMNIVMSLSDRISVMHQGRLLAEGAPREIANNPEVQKAYLGELYDLADVMDRPEAAASG